MAAAPLESSSTPPGAIESPGTTRSHVDPMEDSDPQATRKRPRLDSGSSACETLSAHDSLARLVSESTASAPHPIEQEAPASRRPVSRVAINMKSAASVAMAAESLQNTPEHSAAVPQEQSTDAGAHLSNAISITSSPAQSPESEVAEVEDMDQDPNVSNWKPLEDAFGDRAATEVVQLHELESLPEAFPKLRGNPDLRENLEEISAMIEKAHPNDLGVFLAVKNWLDDVVNNLNQLDYETFIDYRDFWEEVPLLVESLLRRTHNFLPDQGQGPWTCLIEFFVGFARLAVHLIRMDILILTQLAKEADIPAPEPLSKQYLPGLGWILQIGNIPFFRAMERVHKPHIANLSARVNDQVANAPVDAVQHLSTYASCLLGLLPRWPHLSGTLSTILGIANTMVESGKDRQQFNADEESIQSPDFTHTLKRVCDLFRAVDETYQMHISKKSPWLTSETSDSMIRNISSVYHSLSQQDDELARQLSADLSINIPQGTASDEYPVIIQLGWKFSVLKKHIMDGRMELRVLGMEMMQSDLVGIWRHYIQGSPPGHEHPVVRYLVQFLKEHKIVEYVVGIDSHPQLISRAGNIVGFLVVTSTYTDLDTDIIWRTVTESQDPRTVSEVLGMLTKTFPLQQPSSSALLYLCSKLLELPLNRFDARMTEFCGELLHYVREKHSERNRFEPFDTMHVDSIPLRLCVHLIRESTASEDLSLEHKTSLQKFAGSQLSNFIRAGLSETDKLEMYERCLQDIAEMNQFTVGSMQALNALLPVYDMQEVRKLATEFDLTRLVVIEMAHTLDANQIDFTDSFSRNGFLSRVHMLSRLIDKVPDTITPDLADILWTKIFMSRGSVGQGKSELWSMLCNVTNRSAKRNPFIERCIQEYLGQIQPEDYSPEVLAFAKTSIAYEVRFNPPPVAGEDEVVSIPGIERLWNFILTAPPGSIETESTSLAIEQYLDHNLIRRAPRSAVEATHIALVDRCVEQLKSAAAQLKNFNDTAANGDDTPMTVVSDSGEIRAVELRFSRSLLFLRQLLQGLRTRPRYSPPQGPPPNLPERPDKGESIDIKYQSFNGGANSKMRTLRIGDLSTASELVDRLVHLTGFTKFETINCGQKLDLLAQPNTTIRELNIQTGLLIVRKVADSHETSFTGRRQSLTMVDSEVLKHFDDLYDFLNLEDHLAREIYDFLVVFPPQDRVRELVKSSDMTEEDMFPMERPYNLLYSVNALLTCLREEALEATPSEEFVSHSIHVLVSALTRPQMSESLVESPIKLLFACNLVNCLLLALQVRSSASNEGPVVSEPAPLVQQLLEFMRIGQQLPGTRLSAASAQKLVCNSFAVLTEGSMRDNTFWSTVKQEARFDQLVFALLLNEPSQSTRRDIAEKIAIVCGPSKSTKKAGKAESEDAQSSTLAENPTKIDILATLWEAFVQAFPKSAARSHQSEEFFQVALPLFRSVAERSPGDLIFGEYLKQWSGIMLNHRAEEFVGREPVDHLILGFSRLLRSCLELADLTDTPVDTFDLPESLFGSYLFPELSLPSTHHRIISRAPVMHEQTRQELYSILILLSKRNDNFSRIVRLLDDLIPHDYTYASNWCFERYKTIRSPEGYAGLNNLSNTCYLNSLLSQLFMNVEFRDFMLQLQVTDPESSQALLDETKKVFGYMQETWLRSVDPQGLVDTIRTYDNEPIDVTIQMDVDEFYNLLFDRWEGQILDAEAKKKFRSFYGGQLVQQIKSRECPHISERFEPFSAIQCEIKGKASLEQSLQAYVEGEVMQGDNKYSCTSCGRHVDAVKRACLKEVPDNLIFHLKRFDFDMVTMMRSKINDEFQFPEHIDMRPFTVDYLSDPNANNPPDVFRLVGVLVHSGTAESGHYYSYIRERPTADARGSWVEFNDSDVSRFDPSKIADHCFGGYNDPVHAAAMGQPRYPKVWNAYMLFYQRVSSMETVESIKPIKKNIPMRVGLPVPLANHIAMENEVFIRTYCLLDPFHAFFVRYLLCRAADMVKSETGEEPKLVKAVIWIALDTLEQLISRTREPVELENIVSELLRVINETPKGAYWVLKWTADRPAGIRNLLLKSPHAVVRSSFLKIVASSLAKLQRTQEDTHIPESEREKWRIRFLDAFENIVTTLGGLWPMLHTVGRSWDDYFDFLLLLSGFGIYEAGILLENGFLLKCLEMVWLDREDTKKLKRQYLSYCRSLEKGRKFSHRKLMDFLATLLRRVDLTLSPSPDDERRTVQDGKYSINETESEFIRPLGKGNDLLFLRKILQQHISPPACRNIVHQFLEWEPEAGLMEPICKALEDGLRVAPAALCAPFLEATLVFCRWCHDEDRIVALIDFVAKGVESINNSGGKEHLAFLTNVLSIRNDKIERDEKWFSSQIIERIPDWAPTLLIYADKTVRTMTLEVLRQLLFDTESEQSEEWGLTHASIAKELGRACVERLRKTFLSAPDQNIEARVVESIQAVISHCLNSYYGDTEEDQEFVQQANVVNAAIDELSVDLPEELASESDLPSPEDWEDNSMIASDSEIGLAGSP